MSGFQLAARKARRWLPVLLWSSGLTAQTCLVLTPVTVTPDGNALLDLALYSLRRPAPATVQWTFQYAPSSITRLTVDDGPSLTSSWKTAFCAGNATAYSCVATGLNTNTIANGVIARVTAVLAPGATAATIQITNPLGSTTAGAPIPISSMVLSITGAQNSLDCGLLLRPRGPVRGK